MSVFLSAKQQKSIPPLGALAKLLSVTERFIADYEISEDLRLLLASGSSLGGVRPKPSFHDKDGSLSFAKFPKKDDGFNIVAWEAVALTLAKQAKIRIPLYRLETIGEQSVSIIKRFDRQEAKRIPFLSTMSMFGVRDHEQHIYREISYALGQNGASPEEDLKEL